ncbi:MAG: hypothetical protein HYX68_22555 [Planctomycetes bacterium]|nr:hypothetical protein [Planctomycetota bacterium]
MSITIGCPECLARIEVLDEHVGRSGQCPKCQHVFVIPSATQPAPVLRAGETPTITLPPADPWEKPREESEPRPRHERTKTSSSRRQSQKPRQPSGPLWPWVVGILVAFVFLGLMCSSVSVLIFWRKPASTPGNAGGGVLVGRLDGNRAVLQDGVFQIRTELTPNDLIDPDDGQRRCRCKRFEIQLRGDRTYVVEQDSNHFDCLVRIEEPNGLFLNEAGVVGARNARMEFIPPRHGAFVVFATCVDPATGPFTLTIRERDRPKPRVP